MNFGFGAAYKGDMRSFLIVPLLLLIFCINIKPATSQSRSEVVAYNVVGTALLSSISSLILGRVDSVVDFLETFGVGAAGGLGFFTARTLVADGEVEAGVALSFLSSSVVENVTLGEHPLAFFRYGVGPLELRFATAMAKQPKSHIALEVDLAEVPLFLYFLYKADEIKFREGIPTGIVDDADIDVFGARVIGVTPGRSILLARPYYRNENLWRHEAIHVTQDLQFGTGLARTDIFKSKKDSETEAPTRIFSLDYRFGWMLLARIMVDEAWDYSNRWVENEARAFVPEPVFRIP